MNDYATLAHYYDRFVGADYERIIAYIHNVIMEHFEDGALVCDIGCGSGTITLALAELGYDMIGIDGSEEMLNEALEKKYVSPTGCNALFLQQQLPEFELFGTVDVIISTLDTVNYITDKNQLDRLFYWLRNYLNPNGILIFDINTLHKYQNILDGHCAIYEDNDVFLTWRSHFKNSLCNHQITVFKEVGDAYNRFDEEQFQCYHSPDELERLFSKYGFKLLKVNDDYSNSEPSDKTQRITYVLQKQGE